MITSAGERPTISLDKLPRVADNYVFIRVDGAYDDGDVYETKSGLKLILAGGEWEESTRAFRYGKVVAVPKRLRVQSETLSGMEWETDMDVEVGDTVYVGVMASANAVEVIVDQIKHYLIDYGDLIMRIRNGVITPLNGYVIGEKIYEEKFEIEGLDIVQDDVLDRRKARVEFVGKPNRSYYKSDAVDAKVEVCDEIILGIAAFTELESHSFAELDRKLGYVQRRWVIGKE